MSALRPHFAGIVPEQQQEQADIIDLANLVSVLWQRKLQLVAAAVISALLGGFWAAFIATPYYQATTVLMLSEPEETLPSLGALVPGLSSGNNVANTEVEILQSRNLIGAVVDELDLIHDPEFSPKPSWQMPAAVQNRLPQFMSQPARQLSPEQTRTLTIDRLESAISVRNVPDSMVFEALAESEDAQKAAKIINALAEFYIRRQIDVKRLANEQIIEWLSLRVTQLQNQLNAAETEVAQFSAKMELITPETHALLALRLKELRLEIATYETAQLQRNTVRSQNHLSELHALEKELSVMLDRQSMDLVQLQQLQREVEAAQIIHAQFLERLKESTAQMDITQPDSVILSVAETPVIPTRPNPALVILMTGVLGFLLMAMRVLHRESVNKTFYTQQKLEKETGQIALGQTPILPRTWFRGMVHRIARCKCRQYPDNMRQLRNMVLNRKGKAPQVIMVTSALPNDGRTVLTLSLAYSIAQTERRVLVIEGDLHRKGLQKMMRIPFGGLKAALLQNTTLEEAVWRCDALGVDVLKGTNENIEPADLFNLTTFQRLLRIARESYDVILIDTPPVLAVTDAHAIGDHADTILFAVKWGKTNAQAVSDGLRSLKKYGLNVSGLVLTQVHPARQRRYGPEYQSALLNYHA